MRTLVLLSITCLFGCGGSGEEETPADYYFRDGFESVGSDLSGLFPSDNTRWTNVQHVDPDGGANALELVDSPVSEGKMALRFFAAPSDATLSKIDIEKSGFQAFAGNRVIIEADFFITSDESLKDLLLVDLECCECWDPSVPGNQCPGVRLMFGGQGDHLTIERGKILESTLGQEVYSFPRDRWVHVLWELLLADDNSGFNRLVIDDQEVISIKGPNMPNAIKFREAAAKQDIDFNLKEPVYYERVQIGVTANPTGTAKEVYVDNFSLSISKSDHQ